MGFYQILTFVTLSVLLFFPSQFDTKLFFIIGFFALALLPLQIKEMLKHVQHDKKNKRGILVFLFIIFLFFASLSTVFSINRTQSIYQLTLYFYYFIFFINSSFLFSSFKAKERLAVFLVLAAFVLSLISLYNTIFLHVAVTDSLKLSFFSVYYGHNHLSAILIFAIPLCFYFVTKHWEKNNLHFLFLVILYVLFLSFIFTFGIGSIISLGISFFVIFLLFRRSFPSFKFLLKGSVVILIVVELFLSGVLFFYKEIGVKKSVFPFESSRMVYWKQAYNNFLSNPVKGTGIDTFDIVNRKSREKKMATNYAHNFFLQMLSDAGIFGFASAVVLILSVLLHIFRKVKEKLAEEHNILRNSEAFLLLLFAVGLLASSVNSFTDFDWQIPTVFFIFWLIAGLF